MLKLLVSLALFALLTGCSQVSELRRKIEGYSTSVTSVAGLSGTLRAEPCEGKCELVIAPLNEEGRVLSYKVLDQPGTFDLVLTKAARSVFAFRDTNANLQFDDNEAYAWQALSSGQNQPIVLDLRPAASSAPPSVQPLPPQLDLRNNLTSEIRPQLGTVVSLTDPRFDSSQAQLGMWLPSAFMRKEIAGIYALEPYSATKTPVLFVHGINGTPRDFAPLIPLIDSQRYQAWFLYYPTGYEVHIAGARMLSVLKEMHSNFPFKELHIVGHSMGGLVTRSFLNACREAHECEYVRTFTSVSTPFGGASSAHLGVKFSPVVMPVWASMSPKSKFLAGLFSQPLPRGVTHHLVFGYRNASYIPGSGSSDGTITLESQLRFEAQQQASSLLGLDDDHMSILSNPKLAEHLQLIFEGRAARTVGR